MKSETNAKLHKACADLAKEITPHLSGFAPYTPVKVSPKTTPLIERIKNDAEFNPFSAMSIAASQKQREEDIRDIYHREVILPMTNALCEKAIEELEDDGFNPYGSGPEPIGPRES